MKKNIPFKLFDFARGIYFKNKILYVIFLISLCFCDFFHFNLAFAEHGTLIETLRESSTTNSDLTKGEKWLISARACRGFRSAHTSRKVVALTFDDGPSNYTNDVIEILKLNNINATFFFLGKNIKNYPRVIRKAYLDGNVIANHTYSHPYLPGLSGEEIETELTRTSKLIYRFTGVYPSLFRPPYGSCSSKSRRVAKNLGFKTIMWSSSTEDYLNESTTPIKIAFEIISLVHPGAIICLHDGGGNREKTVEALKIIILVLRNEGYEFLTVPELLDIPAYSDNSNEFGGDCTID